jgi:Predicted transcriptional regulators containing the CopG/Arc/MetJ DNA-binding domain
MANETEKLTINLGIVELAQVDVLVEQGIYSNRSDFIRTAIRKQLENHGDRIERALTPIPTATQKDWLRAIGIFTISKEELEEFVKNNEKINISVIGMLILERDINVELFKRAVNKIVIRGKLVASDELKEIVKKES